MGYSSNVYTTNTPCFSHYASVVRKIDYFIDELGDSSTLFASLAAQGNIQSTVSWGISLVKLFFEGLIEIFATYESCALNSLNAALSDKLSLYGITNAVVNTLFRIFADDTTRLEACQGQSNKQGCEGTCIGIFLKAWTDSENADLDFGAFSSILETIGDSTDV